MVHTVLGRRKQLYIEIEVGLFEADEPHFTYLVVVLGEPLMHRSRNDERCPVEREVVDARADIWESDRRRSGLVRESK